MTQDIKIKITNLTKIFGPKAKSVLKHVDNGMSKDDLLKEHQHVLGLSNINLDLANKEHKTDEYKAIAPNSRVPSLILDDGTVILETSAICRYLECIYPEPNLFGESPMEIATIEMWYALSSHELMYIRIHSY